MKKIYAVILSFLFMTLSFNAFASEVKVGFVDRQVLSQDSLYAKKYMEKMKKEFESRQEDLISKEKEIKSKSEALKRDKEILSEKEYNQKEAEITKLQQKLQLIGEEFQSDVASKTEKENKAFEKVLDKVLTNIAKEEKLDIILPKNLALYNTGKADFTYKALKYLDEFYKENAKS